MRTADRPAVVLPGGEPVGDGPGHGPSETPAVAVAPVSRRSVRLVVVAAVTLAVPCGRLLISPPVCRRQPRACRPMSWGRCPSTAKTSRCWWCRRELSDDRAARPHDGADQRWPGVPGDHLRHRLRLAEPAAQVFDVDQSFHPRRPPAGRAEGAAEMRDSQGEAAAVAGVPSASPSRNGSPSSASRRGPKAKDFLAVGDVLRSVSGVAVTTGDQVRTEGAKVAAGSTAKVEVRAQGAPSRPFGSPRTQPGPDRPRHLAGITQDLPVPVTFNAGSIGGPSAGLMFALSVYDKLARRLDRWGPSSRGPAPSMARVRSARSEDPAEDGMALKSPARCGSSRPRTTARTWSTTCPTGCGW